MKTNSTIQESISVFRQGKSYPIWSDIQLHVFTQQPFVHSRSCLLLMTSWKYIFHALLTHSVYATGQAAMWVKTLKEDCRRLAAISPLPFSSSNKRRGSIALIWILLILTGVSKPILHVVANAYSAKLFSATVLPPRHLHCRSYWFMIMWCSCISLKHTVHWCTL